MVNTLSVILGGGKGTRLSPLTNDRAKPAVPFGGKYRLVDIPISNSINAGLRRMYVLTQFNSASLHLHVGRTYNFDSFSQDFCTILSAEQNRHREEWYMGTADAVRKNLPHFRTEKPSHYLILSGDQLYQMDLQAYLKAHLASGAEASIATVPVSRSEADQLGILQIDSQNRILNFLEKPGPEANIDEFRISSSSLPPNNNRTEEVYLASMGIYIFNSDLLEKSLDNDLKDFGKEVFPKEVVGKVDARAYIYDGYWEDIGTIKSFFKANLELTSPLPRFNLYNREKPIYTHRRDLPPSKLHACKLENTLASEGSIISHATLKNCLIGIRTTIDPGVSLQDVYVMGADEYEKSWIQEEKLKQGIPQYGIGEDTHIRGAIIDKNVRIGRGCRLGVDGGVKPDRNGDGWAIRDGVIIIEKNAVIPDSTVI